MTEALEALRGYVHFLREREGLRQIHLTRTAQLGLARLAASASSDDSRNGPRDAANAAAASGGPDNSLSGRPQAARSRLEFPEEPENRSPPGLVIMEPVRPPAVPVAGSASLEIPGSTKAEQLRHLGERAAVCVKCPHLAARRHTVVFGVGDPDARLMFIGEGPGEDEDLQGEPFVGRAGQLLTKMIVAMGLSREQVYIANILKCRPDMPPGVSGNRKPTKQEMETCVPYLRAQIDVIKPGVMVALGATAVEGLLGPVGSVGSLRGRFLEYRGTPLMPTYHPSYLLRNQSSAEKRKVWEDLLNVMERLEMPVTDKQRGFFLAK